MSYTNLSLADEIIEQNTQKPPYYSQLLPFSNFS